MYNYYAYRHFITPKKRYIKRQEVDNKRISYLYLATKTKRMYVYYYNTKAIYDATAFEYGFTTRIWDVGELNFQNFNFRRSFTMCENNSRTPTNSL